VPGAREGALAYAVNRWRTVAGVAAKVHESMGFVRSADGTIATFGDPERGIITEAINDDGTIAGTMVDKKYHGSAFVRTSDGVIKFINYGNARAVAINNSGTVAGSFADTKAHGFLYAADGTFTVFDMPHSRFTEITALNNKGAIAGTYQKRDYAYLAFAGTP